MHFSLQQHEEEIRRNVRAWSRKPLLGKIYNGFHETIAGFIRKDITGLVVEVGSGIGNIKDVIPSCLRTDLFPNPWIDRVENAYALTFDDCSVATLILFDVFHHLQYPGTALKEFLRVLIPGGRVIIFEPCMSFAGIIVYGLFHHEPIALTKTIEWLAPDGWQSKNDVYYAAQGNASRVFFNRKYMPLMQEWNLVCRRTFSAFTYIASGGYSKPQLYPDAWFSQMKTVDALLDKIPILFATRLLVVLERPFNKQPLSTNTKTPELYQRQNMGGPH
jgi:SAM-dependent methyltransferase